MSDYTISGERAAAITADLLDWYDRSKRDLPWRHTSDPYAIWVCEIMAQQTRISFLLNYYERFIARFPTIQALAQADEDDALKAWEGLGYYSRVRNLRRAAQLVADEHDGKLPRTKEELTALPGIGDYTAGAILSIAYGLPEPAVDGNVLRVFARVEASDADITKPETRRIATGFVAAVMPQERTGSFTQALMELGALVCTPKSPDCAGCPLQSVCLGYAGGRQEELPCKTAKKPPETLDKTVLLVRDPAGRVLMRQRTETLLCGLWEFCLIDGALTAEQAGERLNGLGLSAGAVTPVGEARHVFTHRIWQMTDRKSVV